MAVNILEVKDLKIGFEQDKKKTLRLSMACHYNLKKEKL